MIHSILEWKKSPAAPVAEDAEPSAQVESLYLPAAANQEESTLEGDEMEEEGDDTEDEEEDDGKLGCVQVIDDVEFDFEQTEEQQRPAGSPLLGLVLTPTRELAVQVKHHIDAVAKFTSESADILSSASKLKFVNVEADLTMLRCRHQNGHRGGRNGPAEAAAGAEERARDRHRHAGTAVGHDQREGPTSDKPETSPVRHTRTPRLQYGSPFLLMKSLTQCNEKVFD